MKKSKALITVLLTAVLLISVLSSCAPRLSRYYATDHLLFDTVTDFTGYTRGKNRFDEVKGSLFSLLSELHEQFDIYGENRALAEINASVGKSERFFVISDLLYELLSFGKEVYGLTGGKVNIAMGSVLSIWHDCRYSESPRLPDNSELSTAASHTDIDSFSLSRANGICTLTITDPYLKFDVGAIAKGFAARKAIELLTSLRLDGESFLLNLGGMVCPVGSKPNGEAWESAIEYPSLTPKEGYLRIVSIKEGALVTSSNHIRAFTVNGKSYGHIIDPQTLFPPEHFASVTVLCPDPALGDALSTALFCMTEAEGRKLLESHPDVAAMWVYDDMRVSETENF